MEGTPVMKVAVFVYTTVQAGISQWNRVGTGYWGEQVEKPAFSRE